jgi:glutathione S-transferase
LSLDLFAHPFSSYWQKVLVALYENDIVHPIGGTLTGLQAYRARLLARPSFARAVDEARPCRRLFAPGAPDRD